MVTHLLAALSWHQVRIAAESPSTSLRKRLDKVAELLAASRNFPDSTSLVQRLSRTTVEPDNTRG